MLGNIDYPFIIFERKLRKGGSSMKTAIVIDWKFVVALGAVAIGTIFATKMDPEAIKEVSIHAIDTAKELKLANSAC